MRGIVRSLQGSQNPLPLETLVKGIKEKSRSMAYVILVQENLVEFNTRIPTKQEFLIYFRHLRTEKGMTSLNMWTTYTA